MELGGIALVFFKGVLGVAFGHFNHIMISGDLGQDGRGGNGRAFPVSLHHRFVGGRDAVGAVAVDQRQVRGNGQAVNGPLHGQHPGVQNIEGVDLLRLRPGDGPGHGLVPDEVI